MAETDRELRDRLEQAQGDLQRAEKRLAELEAQSTEALTAELAQMTEEHARLKQRLEQADLIRVNWDRTISQRESELAISRAEERRLRDQLDSERLQRPAKPASPPWVVPVFLLAGTLLGAVVLLLLRH